MATTDTLSGNSNYYLEIYAALDSQSVSGWYSRIYYRVRVYKTDGSGYWATENLGNNGHADSNRAGNPDLWNGTDFGYDFRGVSFITFASGYFNIPHNPDGTASYFVNADINLYLLGNAAVGTGTRTLPRLAYAPPAPTSLGLDLITQTSMRYRFVNNGDGGSPVLEWQAAWGTNPGAYQHIVSSNGTTTVTGLSPGTTYYFWSRGRNAVGWGDWSNRSSAKTIAGARVKVNGVWKEAVPYVKVNGVWKLAQPYVKVNGLWRPSN